MDGLVDCLCPFGSGEVASEKHAASAPGGGREPGDFKDQVAFALRKRFEFVPIC